MECGSFVPKHALYQHFPNFWVCIDEGYYQTKFSHLS